MGNSSFFLWIHVRLTFHIGGALRRENINRVVGR